MTSSVLWWRRDLRLGDHPALLEAASAGPDGVVPLVVAAPDEPPTPAIAHRNRSWQALDREVGGLHVAVGDPVAEVVEVARRAGAASVHVTADHTPDGAALDDAVERALAEHDIGFVRTGSRYAVGPGRVLKSDGTPYRVFTPFHRAWSEHGWRQPAQPARVSWLRPPGSAPLPEAADDADLPEAGEHAAFARWRAFLDDDLEDYAATRDLPGHDRTSRLSVSLAWGEIHPRTLLADLADRSTAGAEAFRRELAFREFYADVLHHHPDSAWHDHDRRFAAMQHDGPGDDVVAWQQGRTGFPIVDAGMRQLLAEGWMHNRVRMITASFLVKDLHVAWQHGARHFANHLADFDLASNQHGWQWVAGCGTDAAPYFRVFNPTTQGRKFDPDGAYVRRWIPELRDVPTRHVHEPWTAPEPPADYPPPLVDHAEERAEALRRLAALG